MKIVNINEFAGNQEKYSEPDDDLPAICKHNFKPAKIQANE